MNKAELKDCPFCGGKAKLDDDWYDQQHLWLARCSECETKMYRSTETDAIAAWNTRTLATELAETERRETGLREKSDELKMELWRLKEAAQDVVDSTCFSPSGITVCEDLFMVLNQALAAPAAEQPVADVDEEIGIKHVNPSWDRCRSCDYFAVPKEKEPCFGCSYQGTGDKPSGYAAEQPGQEGLREILGRAVETYGDALAVIEEAKQALAAEQPGYSFMELPDLAKGVADRLSEARKALVTERLPENVKSWEELLQKNMERDAELMDLRTELAAARAELEAAKECTYAYPTIQEYEQITGFKVNNEAFKIGWNMARTTNKAFAGIGDRGLTVEDGKSCACKPWQATASGTWLWADGNISTTIMPMGTQFCPYCGKKIVDKKASA